MLSAGRATDFLICGSCVRTSAGLISIERFELKNFNSKQSIGIGSTQISTQGTGN